MPSFFSRHTQFVDVRGKAVLSVHESMDYMDLTTRLSLHPTPKPGFRVTHVEARRATKTSVLVTVVARYDSVEKDCCRTARLRPGKTLLFFPTNEIAASEGITQ